MTVDGDPAGPAITDTHPTLDLSPGPHTVTTRVAIDPASNTVLDGLDLATGIYVTQCEAEGFRRIT
ncbi:MAG: hypothetical protein ACU0BF_11985 [Paracoccaceae bacterium]